MKNSLENDLANALYRFAYGRLTVEQAENKAKIAIKNFDLNNDALTHKGINWYAKQLVSKM